MREAVLNEYPRTAARLIDYANARGWVAKALTYSTGPWGVKEPRDAVAIGLRLWREDERLFALWVDGKFIAGLSKRLQYFPTVKSFRAYLDDESS